MKTFCDITVSYVYHKFIKLNILKNIRLWYNPCINYVCTFAFNLEILEFVNEYKENIILEIVPNLWIKATKHNKWDKM